MIDEETQGPLLKPIACLFGHPCSNDFMVYHEKNANRVATDLSHEY